MVAGDGYWWLVGGGPGLAVGLAAENFAQVGASAPSKLPHLLQPRNGLRAAATGTVR